MMQKTRASAERIPGFLLLGGFLRAGRERADGERGEGEDHKYDGNEFFHGCFLLLDCCLQFTRRR